MQLKRGGVSKEDTKDVARVMDRKYVGTSLSRRARVAGHLLLPKGPDTSTAKC